MSMKPSSSIRCCFHTWHDAEQITYCIFAFIECEQSALASARFNQMSSTGGTGEGKQRGRAAAAIDQGEQPFLSTLPAPGEAQFLTVLKPCSILLRHVRHRATEFYSILFGARSLLAVPACVCC
jgi:hypothetical protein